MYVHATHTVHALPDLRVAGGRLGDGVSFEFTSFDKPNSADALARMVIATPASSTTNSCRLANRRISICSSTSSPQL